MESGLRALFLAALGASGLRWRPSFPGSASARCSCPPSSSFAPPEAGALDDFAAGRFLLPRMAPEWLERLVELFLWAAALGLMAGLIGGASPPARASG